MQNIAIICGGKSAEHEVSINSARNIINALDKSRYRPIIITVSRSGCWYFYSGPNINVDFTHCDDNNSENLCYLVKTPEATMLQSKQQAAIKIDVVFPIIHGPLGEDGALQGLLDMMHLPYVGSGVTASALGMDKTVMKQVWHQAGIKFVPYLSSHRLDPKITYEKACTELKSKVFFVKPAVMGSSVGVSKAKDAASFAEAVTNAFRYSEQIIIEPAVENCREIECAVLGNDKPIASVLGEIKPNHEFYSYEAKYIDPDGAELVIPAILPAKLTEKIQQLAIASFRSLGCKGLARVDFFVTPDEEIFVNELNTLPGFTMISMYPKLFIHTGISYSELIDQLINLAKEEFARKQTIEVV